VPEYLVELYLSQADGAVLARETERARRAAEELSREGVHVRCVHSIFVPEEETCFLLYDAVSAEAVREAARRARLPFEHVSEAFTGPAGAEVP
jgi:Nickel responsive protein SCO4226-like